MRGMQVGVHSVLLDPGRILHYVSTWKFRLAGAAEQDKVVINIMFLT